ncbi:hypothetical protein [Natronoarchaeum rubrum]|uniref:hypothetical protein n=1 Tax=Natronoarchaeum rubrum TaxID=755311 RepID=UPI00211266C5|nr:hypothetical protein [Natronoarchaeum rubrum]
MVEEFSDELQSMAGEDLRAVATFGKLDYDVAFIRDDVRERYSRERLDELYRNLVSDGIANDEIGQQMAVGEQQARIKVFENVIVLVFPSSRYEGVFVSIDRDPDVPILDIIDLADAEL